ncbi:MAG: hypothetical protein P4L53_03785 [Candidatus Obscuribacterales bacterium]|nr:hypothetical protein [Candidatus Obscuribacterales bacterium]
MNNFAYFNLKKVGMPGFRPMNVAQGTICLSILLLAGWRPFLIVLVPCLIWSGIRYLYERRRWNRGTAPDGNIWRYIGSSLFAWCYVGLDGSKLELRHYNPDKEPGAIRDGMWQHTPAYYDEQERWERKHPQVGD